MHRNNGIEDIYPLSPMQQGLLFHTLRAPSSGVYIVQSRLTLLGEIDAECFRAAWRSAIARHSALRTAFRVDLDSPLQIVYAHVNEPVGTEDWRRLSPSDRRERLTECLRADLERGFDPTCVPLWRVLLIRVEDQRSELIFSVHHAIMDGWSIARLIPEVFSAYDKLRSNQVVMSSPVRPYRDYIAWLQGQQVAKAEEFWREELADFRGATLLRSAVHGSEVGDTHHQWYAVRRAVVLPESTTALERLARHYGLTLNTVAQGVWALLLGRYCGSSDVCFGVTVANRPADIAGVETIVGLLINTLPMRIQILQEQRCVDWLQNLQRHDGSVREFDYLPLQNIKMFAGLAADGTLFDTLYVFENYPGVSWRSHGESGPCVIDIQQREQTNFPLSVTVGFERTLNVSCLYDTRCFQADAVERLLGHFEHLLEQIVAHPRKRLAELKVLRETERQQLLVHWNATDWEYPRERCVHELFAEQVVRTPSVVALVYEEDKLTYRELDRRSNQVANHLCSLGVGPEVIVGLCLERSVEMVVGMLGILKAGGAYLPLDPDYPAERLQYMLEDARAPLLLTDGAGSQRLAKGAARTIQLDQDWPSIARGSRDAPESGVGPENLIYVIYTSGSTGRPKGVMNKHRALANRLCWMQETGCLKPGDRVLHKTPMSFDVSVWEIFCTLLHGATLVISRPGGHKDAAYLSELIRREEVSVLHFVPSMLSVFLKSAGAVTHDSVRLLAASGETLPSILAAAARACFPGAVMANLYGPTEAAVEVSCHVAVTVSSEPSIPIGRPIWNTQLYVLDDEFEPVPVGVAGQLYIGGAGLARGYLNRPGLTAERFVPSPFGDGERLYRTGDLARYLVDGNLVFIGRMDTQVKLRGFRIELGEIEAALRTHACVQDAVVVAREEEFGEKRLVGYVMSAAEAPVGRELREHLRRSLPEYMVPAVFVILDRLPLTANGKVNRSALPAPESRSPEQEYLEPRTPTEQALAQIWKELLHRDIVGVKDEFFELGGHSLLAMQLVGRIRQVFEVELELREVFEQTRLAELAQRIEARGREQQGLLLPPLQKQVRKEAIPLSYAQERLWFVDQLGLSGTAYHIPVHLRLEGALDVAALEMGFAQLIMRHESLRTRFELHEGQGVQRIDPSGEWRLTHLDLSALPEEERAARLKESAQQHERQPFDLRSGPLLRVQLIRLAPDEHVLLVNMHHIIADGWSSGVLTRELSVLYAAAVSGTEAQLAPLPVQYADYAIWQRQWLQGEVLDRQLSFWRAQLRDAPPLLQLPTDRARPAVASFHGGVSRFELTAELSRGLHHLARTHRATLHMVLLGAFQVLLSRYSGQRDIVVGTAIAGRTHAETEGLIGFFVNRIISRIEISRDLSFVRLLQRVKEYALRAYAHQDIPFERLVSELQPQRDLSRQPVLQVMFVLQNQPQQTLNLPGITFSLMDTEQETAKFDLLLSMQESAAGVMGGAFEYATDLFDATTIARLSGHFEHLLEQVVAHPHKRLAELSMLSDAERKQQLVQWNDTAQSYPARCVHELFSEQAARTPQAVALVYESEQLSYRTLEERANQLAHHLMELGIGAESVVALGVERSPEMVVGLLGILKAGAAYLPLDPGAPQERLAFMLADARARVLVTQESLQDLTSSQAIQRVYLDEDWPQIAAQPTTAPESAAKANNLAYVIYTSGSTGRPKGVMVPHDGLVNYATYAAREFEGELGNGSVISTSIAFDLGLTGLYPMLICGRPVRLLTERGDANELVIALKDSQDLTVVKLTPSYLAALDEVLSANDLQGRIRNLVVGGEKLTSDTARRWQQRDPAMRIFNHYGPTETVIGRVLHKIEDIPDTGVIPIGRPIANTHVYVLDEELDPVPIGVVGKLHIGGVGLARGYLNRAGLTAECFVANPYGEAGARMYRTGDQVRWRAEGELEYLGRQDQQVKLRGFRIELGEIEAALRTHACVRDAVVVACEESPGGKYLVGYVVGAAEAAGGSELREHLRRSLPDYMVPAAFVSLDRLPLTPNGKVDRAALPEPESWSAEQEHLEPRTPTERALTQLWKELLQRNVVGVRDGFFKLGGDSILAIKMAARASQAGIKLTVRQIFEHPTIEQLAKVAGAAGGVAEQEIVQGEVPLTPIQCSFFERESGSVHHYNQSVLLQSRRPLTGELLRQVLSELMKHHDALRLRYERNGDRWQQRQCGWEVSQPVPFEQVDLSGLSGEEQGAAFLSKAAQLQESLNLSAGPLVRMALFDLGAERPQKLLWIIHHLAVDGVSWRILLEDWQRAYEQLLHAQPVRLAAKSTSFRSWAQQLAHYAHAEAMQSEWAYWQHLTGLNPPLLPVDHRAGQNTKGSMQELNIILSVSETQALLERVPAAYHTHINDVLLTALVQSFEPWTGQHRLLIAVEGHGREELMPGIYLSRTVGWFTTVFPVLLELPAGEGVGEQLQGVKEQLRRIPQRGIGYGIGRYLGPDAGRAHYAQLAEPQVSFNYLGQFDQRITHGAWLELLDEFAGPAQSAQGMRRYLIDVVSRVVLGQLQMKWRYSDAVHERRTIESLAQRYLQCLQTLIAHCRSSEGGYSPSDFPLISIRSQD